MWGPGAEQGGILQTSRCRLDLKEPYYRMSQPQAYSSSQDQQPNQLLQLQGMSVPCVLGTAERTKLSRFRQDWAKKLVHWKTEFLDTLKHYWLGIKLLGVDVKISSKLLVEHARGKSLSRRDKN
ncbi:LETM1-like protein [Artemisia annua]|uniref:LETM1-like protein n=1 Tax=Artemisia annua TaxID=35608 RepID=A0A2U1MW55_ARTAN|nr:LETM1-like protein [Artemisia annua]